MNRLLCLLLVAIFSLSQQSVAATFHLNVVVTPEGGGSLNTSSGDFEEGSSVYLRTYANTGFRFLGWYENEERISEKSNFNYTMPAHDANVVAKYEYDPDVPADPAMPDTTTYYLLQTVINPEGAGSLNLYDGRYAAGASVNLRAYNNTGFRFINWQDQNGNIVSESSSFRYTMPANDVTLTANYDYNPDLPADPDSIATKYNVSLECRPEGAGYFSNNVNTATAGSEIWINAYPNSGYRFIRWEDADGNPVATEPNIYYTVPNENVTLYGIFEFDPAPPSNPNANYWDETSGEAILDDFYPGYLYDVISNLTGYGNLSKVANLIVKGEINSYDINSINYFSNAATIDLARTGGTDEIPNYAFSNLSVSNIILPSTISKLGYYLFRECPNLTALTIYAQEPPKCDPNTFSEFSNKDNCTIYVPASAIELYSNADYWKDFTILPITSDAHVLQVNLPEVAADGRYKNYTLEIVNLKSGVRQRYIVSDRMLYTFNGLLKDEEYNVYLISQTGFEIGSIEGIVIPEDDVEVTFDTLKTLHTVTAKVTAPDGSDVTDSVTVEWLRPQSEGLTYLRKGVSVSDIPEDLTLICRVTLDNKLGVVYTAPKDTEFSVNGSNATCEIPLQAIRDIALSGLILDGDEAPLKDASVSVSQMINGRFSKSYTTKTGRDGKWELTVLDVPETRITYSASECVNLNDTIASFAPDATSLDMGSVTLRSIVGARITYGFTYHAAGEEEIENYYPDYQNVIVSVFNTTQNRQHNDVSLQYPMLAVLDENINSGDELQLTATSKTGAFKPITETVTVNDKQRAEVTFDIVGKGGIKASFEMTENPAVIAMLYNSKGELQKKGNYSEANAIFTGLDDGDYALITMGQSDLMSSILRLANLAEVGLTEGKDFVKNEVTVESGKLTEVNNREIPAFDESLFYYTGSATNFSSNKSSITTGNYLTLRSAIDFKNAYKDAVKNVALIVDLPDACDFVEQSVIQGPNLLPYTLDGKRLTIQLGDKYESQVRFCVIPTAGGTFNASASIAFDCNGKTVTQPIGSAISEIKDLEISIPEIIQSSDFNVCGIAPINSIVTIYSGLDIIGNTKTKSNGRWEASCNINRPFNMTDYNIFAKITTEKNVLLTKTRTVKYIKNYPTIKTIRMNTSPEVVFDFENRSTSHSWYYTPSNVLFILNFSNNNPDIIQEVYLNIYGEDGSIKVIDCSYDNDKSIWFTNVNFTPFNGIINLSVNYTAVGDYSYESSEAQLIASTQEDNITKENEKFKEFKEAITQTLNDIKSDSIPKDDIINIISVIRKKVTNYYCPIPTSDDGNIIGEKDLDNLKDPNYSGGKVILFGDRPEDKDPKLDPYYENLGSPYNSPLSLPEGKYTNTICSHKDTTTDIQIIPGDFDFESLINNNESGSFTVTNSIGDSWSCDTNFSQPLNPESPESVKDFFEAASEERQNAYIQWAQSADGALTAADLTATLAISVQTRYFNANFDQLAAIAGSKNPVVQKEAEALGKTVEKNLTNLKNAKIASNVISGASAFVGGYGIGKDITTGYGRYDEWTYIINSIQSLCNGSDIESLINKAKEYRLWVLLRDSGKAIGDIGTTGLGITGAVLAPETAGMSLLLNLASAGISIGLTHWENNYVRTNTQHIAEITRKARISKSCPNDPFPYGYPGNPYYDGSFPNSPYYGGYTPTTPPFDPLTINHDPSGFVYEAVPANRVEGVQATIYYKETKEDMYGDPYDEVILWDAEEYAQKNPLFTDENGMYQWDVPQGLWQVKFEKEGYATAYSEWLPVPPPQLEVNIGIIQSTQPEVTEARAYEDGVEVQFSKYMDMTTLHSGNIYVTANGEKLNGEISFINATLADEYASEEDANALRYASRIRFVPEQPLSVTTGEIRLTVSRNVLSYAGAPMTETYSQTLDVEKEVQEIVADNVKVLYGGEKEVTIYALPYDAAVGRTLHIANSSDLIASVDKTEATIDEEGKATIIVKGELPGRAQLTFTIDDVTATGECTLDVVTEIITAEAPKASRASGTAVYRGSKIELTTDSKNGVIYFTTDGSCPCDENGTRRKYTVPIVIDADTKILAMTMIGSNGNDVSETVEFNYTLKKTDMELALEEGWNWISHTLETPVESTTVAAEENVIRIKGKDKEIVRDADKELTGNLSSLSAAESYKVETTGATSRIRLNDVAWNPATPIAVSNGWNWLGFPVEQTMTPDEAFAPTDVETLDIVVGQNGFAQFDGEKWVGTLTTMSPGLGYMYHSVSAKNVIYNSSIISDASAKSAAGISTRGTVAVDIRKYPDIMPLVAKVTNLEGADLDNENYIVNAFCGTECRGTGRVVNGLIMMNVYGNAGDEITFRITDSNETTSYSNSAVISLDGNVPGSIHRPYAIAINPESGVGEVSYEGKIRIKVEGDRLFITGISPEDIELVEIYDLDGHKLLHAANVTEAGIKISPLGNGVFIVTVKGIGEHTYHKIAIR
ncbi:hypothetical protein EEL33_13840 [Muribaculaceae bacterium Isolate-037 (Harlan)]|nr:hypothetical protein EEL33_13840 [Muribaculaceae bacterium Isolate-037 (Harlan)]